MHEETTTCAVLCGRGSGSHTPGSDALRAGYGEARGQSEEAHPLLNIICIVHKFPGCSTWNQLTRHATVLSCGNVEQVVGWNVAVLVRRVLLHGAILECGLCMHGGRAFGAWRRLAPRCAVSAHGTQLHAERCCRCSCQGHHVCMMGPLTDGGCGLRADHARNNRVLHINGSIACFPKHAQPIAVAPSQARRSNVACATAVGC